MIQRDIFSIVFITSNARHCTTLPPIRLQRIFYRYPLCPNTGPQQIPAGQHAPRLARKREDQENWAGYPAML